MRLPNSRQDQFSGAQPGQPTVFTKPVEPVGPDKTPEHGAIHLAEEDCGSWGTRCHPSCRRRLRVVVKQGGLRSGFLELPLAVCQSQSSKPGSDGCADSPVEGKFKLRGILVSLRLSRHGHPILAHRFNGGVETGVGQKVPSGTKDERCFLKGVRSLQS